MSDGAAYLIHVSADAAHLLAAGAWLGGLLPLGYLLALAGRSREHGSNASLALLRFSGMGYTAVLTLVVSGLINTWFLVGSVSALTASPYGLLLLAKLCLFAGMVALAALNRFWLVPSLTTSTKPVAQASAVFVRLRRHVLCEQAIGLVVVFIVSMLGMTQPAINA